MLYYPRQLLQPGLLRELRESLRWTQQRMVDEVKERNNWPPEKLDLKTYQRWERGERQPHLLNLLALHQTIEILAHKHFVLRPLPFEAFKKIEAATQALLRTNQQWRETAAAQVISACQSEEPYAAEIRKRLDDLKAKGLLPNELLSALY